MIKMSSASRSTLSFPSMPQLLGIQQNRTCVPLSLNNQRRFMIWQIKGFQCLHPQSPASRILGQSKQLHRGELGPCSDNSPVPE